jgi:two-component system phosphate regulon sensor histidine kinase PhoR
MQGVIETLLNGALEDEKVNRLFLQKAMKNINRLTMLTQDLMEITKLETGEFKIVRSKFELEPLIKEVVEGLHYKAERENISLVLEEIDPETMVYADRKQIRQVLNNLVENGIKYNVSEGQVFLKTRIFPKNPSKIEVLVKDTGFGIEQKYLNRLTERFFRIDKSRSREKGGTGLGLSIVKHILEAHGERLSISSQPNNGSTFSFTLDNAHSIQD